MGQTGPDDLAEILTPDELTPVKKSLELAGHATSVTLEPAFWRHLAALARRRNLSMNALVTTIDAARATEYGGRDRTLAATLRRYVLRSLAE